MGLELQCTLYILCRGFSGGFFVVLCKTAKLETDLDCQSVSYFEDEMTCDRPPGV